MAGRKLLHASTSSTTLGLKPCSAGSIPLRTWCKPQPPMANWLGLENTASVTRECQRPIPGSEIPSYIFNSNNLGTKIETPQVDTALLGVEAPTPLAISLTDWGSRSQGRPRKIGSHPRIIEPCIDKNFIEPGTKFLSPRCRCRPAQC